MEDEQGDDAAQGSNIGGVSVSPLSEKLATEPFVENKGGENEVHEFFEDEDGEEIMIEIVGSDVFVNGVSGQKEDCLVSGEVEDWEGHAWVNREEIEGRDFWEAMDVNKMGDSEIGFVGSHDYAVISEEKAIKDVSVDKDSANLVISEVLNCPVEDFVEGNFGKADKEAADLSDGERGIEVKIVDEKVLAAESKDSIIGTDALVSDVQDENQGCNDKCLKNGGDLEETDMVHQNHVVSNEPTERADGDEIAEMSEDNGLNIEIQADAEENQPNIEHIDPEISVQSLKSPRNSEIPAVKNQDCLKEFHGITHASHEISYVSENGEVKGVKFDGVLDFKDGASDIDLQDVNCVGNDKCLKNGGYLEEIDMVHQNHVVSNEPTERAVSTENISLSAKETCVHDVATSNEAEENSRKTNCFYIAEGHTSETKPMNLEDERESDEKYNGEKMTVEFRKPELETDEPISESDNFKLSDEETMKPARINQSRYLLHEGNFVQSDLVWGKVRSHPWWPGQIFDPSDASEKAVRYYKKEDSYLVAYFGDRTFAWIDKSNLKTFGSYFSEMENESNSEAFQSAVTSALEEVSRRVELGLSCSCVPKDVYGKIEAQIIDNVGIREQSSERYGVDHSSRVSYFEPDKLLYYVRDLAPIAFSGADRLYLVIARAQLSAFCRFKGYCSLTEFVSYGELLENDTDSEKMSDKKAGSKKQKKTPKIGSRSRKKRSWTEFMGDGEYSPDAENMGKSVPLSSGRKRKTFDLQAHGSNKRVAKVSNPTSQNLTKPSFKIGECIRRAASRLTGPTPTPSVKSNNNDEMEIDGSPKIFEQSENKSVFVPEESFSVDEMLYQLELAAQNPKKGDDFRNDIRTFFTGFRSSVVLNRRVSKKKDEPKFGGISKDFEFDDLDDSYWTDRIVRNDSEDQSVKSGRKSHSRKRLYDPTAAMELNENVKRREQESSPAELILNFAERKCFQSEINLNKMFRRFGPLMESETEVDRDSGRAKVIFKRVCDAEVALNSAEKIAIFGPVVVNYEIGYSPLISVKILPIAVPQCQEDETLMT